MDILTIRFLGLVPKVVCPFTIDDLLLIGSECFNVEFFDPETLQFKDEAPVGRLLTQQT